MNSRRSLLVALGFVPAILAATYLGIREPYERLIVEAISRRLDWLKIDKAGLAKFAEDFVARHPKTPLRTLVISSSTMVVYGLHRPSVTTSAIGRRLAIFEDFVCEQFLLGSDLFSSDGNENSIVRYIAFPDPYERGCANPFARYS